MTGRIEKCRVSGSRNLISVLSLGEQAFTGIFPRSAQDDVPTGPLELAWCPDSDLLQLAHQFDLAPMYGSNYGYRSGLNQSMIRHLDSKAQHLVRQAELEAGDAVVDIGSNDGTFLNSFRVRSLERVGVDPTATKFQQFYDPEIRVLADFFAKDSIRAVLGNRKANLITSIAMFYDVEDPIAFARDVHELLADRGLWHFEQSYMPSMLRLNSYDTVCHEHVQYYSMLCVNRILEAAELEIVDVAMNAVNGGSFAVTAARVGSGHERNHAVIGWLLETEKRMGLHTPQPFRDFERRVFEHRRSLRDLIRGINASGKTIFGYGASTKGNVLLQFCGLTAGDLPCIADVNPEKFGSVTPGTHIPIVSEQVARAQNPDYFLVLPWHFKSSILEREKDFLAKGGHMIFPMPEIEIV
jgi:hypothetical protein